jgi:hypothetical protein
MSVANTRHVMTALILLLQPHKVVEPIVVGAITISRTRTELLVLDALISVMTHGLAVVNMIPTSVVLDGNATRLLVNVSQTWLEKDMVATLPVLHTATHIQSKTSLDAIQQAMNVKSANPKIKVAILIKLRPVMVVKHHQRVNGNATELTQQRQNVQSAKTNQFQQTARAVLKPVNHVLHHKSSLNVTRRN